MQTVPKNRTLGRLRLKIIGNKISIVIPLIDIYQGYIFLI